MRIPGYFTARAASESTDLDLGRNPGFVIIPQENGAVSLEMGNGEQLTVKVRNGVAMYIEVKKILNSGTDADILIGRS